MGMDATVRRSSNRQLAISRHSRRPASDASWILVSEFRGGVSRVVWSGVVTLGL